MSSNNPAHPDNNRHHTEGYRSYEDWASSNLSDAPTGEPDRDTGYRGKVDDDALVAAMMPWLDDNGNLGGIENQQPKKHAATAAITCGYRV